MTDSNQIQSGAELETSPSVDEEAIARIARALQRARGDTSPSGEWGGGMFLVGAGASISAGIPAGRTVAHSCAVHLANRYGLRNAFTDTEFESALRWLKQEGHVTKDVEWSNAYAHFFGQHYRDPIEQRGVIERALAKGNGSINWAHLCLGELISSHFVHTVLTTNFDQLVLEGTVYAGVFPVIADGIEALSRIDPRPKHPQVVHIHGSRHAYRLLNSSKDVAATADSAAAQGAIFSLIQQAPFLVIAGYAGGEEGIMSLLIKAVTELGRKDIYWVMYDDDVGKLSPRAADLMRLVDAENIVPGQDADEFFVRLMGKLGIGVPAWLDNPLKQYKDAVARIARPQQLSIAKILDATALKLFELEGRTNKPLAGIDRESQLDSARRAALAGDAEAALSAFQSALQNADENPAEVFLEAARTAQQLTGTDSSSLENAEKWFRLALSKTNRQESPDRWADTQEGLGAVLLDLAYLRRDASMQSNALAAFQEALNIYSREQHADRWASIQSTLGDALRKLGVRTKDEKALRGAITAYRSALEIYSMERSSSRWASTKHGLAVALSNLGERTRDEEALRESIECYRETLEVRTRSKRPLAWASIQSNLGSALRRLGQITGEKSYLRDAISIFRAALEIRVREKFPIDWSSTQNSLGIALSSLGSLTKDPETLREGIEAFRASLEVRSEDTMPDQWVISQANLGLALGKLGELTNDKAVLTESIDTFRAGESIRAAYRSPLELANDRFQMANSLAALGELTGDKSILADAFENYKSSLEVFESLAPRYVRFARQALLTVGAKLGAVPMPEAGK